MDSLNSMNMPFSMSTLLISIWFSFVGLFAFRFGKKKSSARHMILGLILMGYGYFVYNAWASFAVGSILTVLLFWPPL